MKKKVYLLVGPYNAIGGVNIHLTRLSYILIDHYDIKYINESPQKVYHKNVFNLRTINLIKYIYFILCCDVVHIHTGAWWLRIVHTIFARLMRKKTIVTIHSLTNLQSRKSRHLTKSFMMLADKVVVVSEQIKGVLKIKNSIVIPAFIPPQIKDEKDLPISIVNLLERSNEKIIISNASDLIKHKGQDLYGLDILIEVAIRIKKEKLNCKIIFVLASVTKNVDLLKNYEEIIRTKQIENIIHIYTKPISFIKLILCCDLVIRATNDDGDSITIREALYFQKPVIASDVVKRPEGTIIFQNRDSNDLYYKIKKVFEEDRTVRNEKIDVNSINNKYLELISR